MKLTTLSLLAAALLAVACGQAPAKTPRQTSVATTGRTVAQARVTTAGQYDAPVTISGTLPDGSFSRFGFAVKISNVPTALLTANPLRNDESSLAQSLAVFVPELSSTTPLSWLASGVVPPIDARVYETAAYEVATLPNDNSGTETVTFHLAIAEIAPGYLNSELTGSVRIGIKFTLGATVLADTVMAPTLLTIPSGAGR